MTPECNLACANSLGEGPLCMPAERRLYWTDIPSRSVHRFDLATVAHDVIATPDMVTAMAPRRTGGPIVATDKGVDLWDVETDTHTAASRHPTPTSPATGRTTGRIGLSAVDLADEPLAGGLFALDTGVNGIAEVPFAG